MSRRKNFHPTPDNTRGNSAVYDPRTYKGDALVQAWIDSRILATLSEWLDTQGRSTRYMSEVLKIPLEILVDYLENIGEVTLIEDTDDARRMLENKYRVRLNPGNRGRKNEQHNKLLSSIQKGGSSYSLGDSVINSAPNTLYGGDRVRKPVKESQPVSDASKAIEEFWAKKEEEDRLEQKERLAAMPVDENGMVITVTSGRGDYTEKDRLRDRAERIRNEKLALVRKCEEMADMAEVKGSVGNKVKKVIDSSEHKALTDEELDRKDRERAEKDNREKAAWDNIDRNELRPIDD